MNFTVGNVRITVSFLLAVGLCAGTLLPGHLLPLLWLAILLHECGHFIYIAAAGKKIGVICIYWDFRIMPIRRVSVMIQSSFRK